MDGFTAWLVNAYWRMRCYDLPNPNWVAILISLILWPLALIWWDKRKVNKVSNLLVTFEASCITIGCVPHHAVNFVFSNRTSSVVYLNGPQLRNCSVRFPIPPDAAKDIGANAYPLSFLKSDGGFEGNQAIIQTGDQARTSIAVKTAMPNPFYHYTGSRLRRFFRRPKYFMLEYSATVGESRYTVATVF